MAGYPWSASDESTLMISWERGDTAEQIGAKLNRTPASIIGKAHQMSLSSRRRGKRAGFAMPSEQRELIGKSMKTFWNMRKMQIAMEQNS